MSAERYYIIENDVSGDWHKDSEYIYTSREDAREALQELQNAHGGEIRFRVREVYA
jgi:hypothetical protein